MSEAVRQSPLIDLVKDENILLDYPAIAIREKPFLSHYIVRGHLNDPSFSNAVASILSLQLPDKANTVNESDSLKALWMSPDQWLILGEADALQTRIAMFEGALESIHGLISDVSSAQTVIHISGEKAHDLLCKGAPLDVHPGVFAHGQCAQTVFAKMNVLIYPEQQHSRLCYHLIVRRSFADFLGRWLINACKEYL